jgi:hypothetical protein
MQNGTSPSRWNKWTPAVKFLWLNFLKIVSVLCGVGRAVWSFVSPFFTTACTVIYYPIAGLIRWAWAIPTSVTNDELPELWLVALSSVTYVLVWFINAYSVYAPMLYTIGHDMFTAVTRQSVSTSDDDDDDDGTGDGMAWCEPCDAEDDIPETDEEQKSPSSDLLFPPANTSTTTTTTTNDAKKKKPSKGWFPWIRSQPSTLNLLENVDEPANTDQKQEEEDSMTIASKIKAATLTVPAVVLPEDILLKAGGGPVESSPSTMYAPTPVKKAEKQSKQSKSTKGNNNNIEQPVLLSVPPPMYRVPDPSYWSQRQPVRTTMNIKCMLDQMWTLPANWCASARVRLVECVLACLSVLAELWHVALLYSNTSRQSWDIITRRAFHYTAAEANKDAGDAIAAACDVCAQSNRVDALFQNGVSGMWIYASPNSNRYVSATLPVSQPIHTTPFGFVSTVYAEWIKRGNALQLTAIFVNDTAIQRPSCTCAENKEKDNNNNSNASSSDETNGECKVAENNDLVTAEARAIQSKWKSAVDLCIGWTALQTHVLLCRGPDASVAVTSTMYTMQQHLDPTHPIRVSCESALTTQLPSAVHTSSNPGWSLAWFPFQDDLAVMAEDIQLCARTKTGASMRFMRDWVQRSQTRALIPYVDKLLEKAARQIANMLRTVQSLTVEHRQQWKQWCADLRAAAGIAPLKNPTDEQDAELVVGTLIMCVDVRTHIIKDHDRSWTAAANAWVALLSPAAADSDEMGVVVDGSAVSDRSMWLHTTMVDVRGRAGRNMCQD